MKSEHLFGWHAISAVLTRDPARVRKVWLLEGRQDQRSRQLVELLEQKAIPVQEVSRRELDERVAEGGVHQGIVADVKPMAEWQEADLLEWVVNTKETPFLLVLDGVTDPHNLGACLRSADAVGVHAVIVPKDKSASMTPVVRKVACGAAETVPLVRVTNLARYLRELKDRGVWLAGAAGEAEKTLYQADLRGSLAVVMGAEGKGMRRLTREHCDLLVSIPMRGLVDSLNVSVATGVLLFEAGRQRMS